MVTNNCSDAIHPIKCGGVGSGETIPKPISSTTAAVITNTRGQNIGDMKVNVLLTIGEANSLAARVIKLGNTTKYNREIGRFLATRVETCKSILSTFRPDVRYFKKQYKEYIDMLQRIRLYIIKVDQSAAWSEMILQPSKSFFGTFKIAQMHNELADSLDRIVYDVVLESFVMQQQHNNDSKNYNHPRAKLHHKIEEIKKLKEAVYTFLLSSLLKKCKSIQLPAKNLSGLPTWHGITSLPNPEEMTTTTQNTQVVPCKRGLTLWKDSHQAYYFALFCEHLLNSTFYGTLLNSLQTDDLTLSPKNKKRSSNLVKEQELSNLVDSQNHQTLTVVSHVSPSEPSSHTTTSLTSEPESLTEKRPNQTPIFDRPNSTASESTLFEQGSITDERQISAESMPMTPEKTPTRKQKNFLKYLYRPRKSTAPNFSLSPVDRNDQRPVSALSDVTISATGCDVVVPDESTQSTQASNKDKRKTELASDAPQKASEPASQKKKWYQKLARKPQNSKSSTTAATKTEPTKKKIPPFFSKALGASKKEDKQKSKSLKMDNNSDKKKNKKNPKKTDILKGYGEIMKVVNVDAFCII